MNDKIPEKLPEAVFFDWDGTLADTYNFLNDAHNSILQELGFAPLKEGQYKRYFGMPRDILYPEIYKDKHEEAKALFEKYVFHNTDRINPLDGAIDILKYLKEHGVVLGIISNKKSMFLRREIEHFGWQSYFSIIVGAGEAPKDKPSGAPLLYAASEICPNIEKQSIWYVGDTENDLSCAKEAGSPAVYIKGHEAPEPLIQKYAPLIFAQNCKEFHKILVAIPRK